MGRSLADLVKSIGDPEQDGVTFEGLGEKAVRISDSGKQINFERPCRQGQQHCQALWGVTHDALQAGGGDEAGDRDIRLKAQHP